MTLKSIVFLPAELHDTQRWMAACAQYCAARSYEVVAVVSTWRDAWKLINQGRAAILVIGRRDHLPPGFEPRLEVVTEQTTPVAGVPARRRPKRIMVRRQVP